MKFSQLVIKDKSETPEKVLQFADERLLTMPAVAISQIKKDTFEMADKAMESLKTAFTGFINKDMDAAEKVVENNEKIIRFGEEISNYLVKISASGVSLADEKKVNALHNNVGDIARVSELAENFTKYTRRAVRDNLQFSEGINEKLSKMHELLHEQYGLVKRIVVDKEHDLLAQSDVLEEEIDNSRRALVSEHIERLAQGKCRPENNTIFVNLVCNLERIGDHLSFVAHSVEA